ncbi:MAG: zinc ribbon domain-containing protein [Anaerolineae bacterium]|nr:zinc ribbon domain-containing protein [Anaerolineae bacterium]
MKKTFLSILIFALFSLFFATSAQAQLPTDSIETLILDLWPDYDEPSVLVLLTGTLAPDTPLPATISIPLHAEADVNAVARITAENQMIDDIQYTIENDTLTMTTPDLRFRVEYYAPYQRIGNKHAFTFDWLADISVASILAAVQQPLGATNMNVTPTTATVVADTSDGFTYYTFPPEAIPAGEQYNIAFDYDMVTQQLSIENLPSNPSAAVNAANEPGVSTSASSASPSLSLDNINLAYVVGLIGIVLVAVVVTWQVATRKTQPTTRKNRKTQPKRTAAAAKPTGKVQFCHQCGNKLTGNDKFCRECGTAVKGSNRSS